MSDKTQQRLIKMVTMLMRIGVIAYLFTVLFPYIENPGFTNTFGNWTLRWFLIILLASAALLLLVVARKYFLVYGFFMVFLAAMFHMFLILLKSSPIPDVFTHFFIASISVYFMTRDIRTTLSSGHKHRKSKS
jgi:hypothetical protein